MQNQKRLICIGLLALLPAITQAQSVKLHGTIKNPLADSVTVSFDNNEIYYEQKKLTVPLNKEGQFIMELPAYYSFNRYEFENGNQATEFFAAPGADLSLTLDGNNFDSTLHYEGNGSEVANFIAKHMLEYSYMYQFGADVSQLHGKEADEFYTGLKVLQQKQIDFLAVNGKQLPPSFQNYWNAYFDYTVYNSILEYPYFHEIAKQHSYTVTVPPENYKITEKVPAKFSDEYLGMTPYNIYLERYYFNKLSAAGVKNPEEKPFLISDSVVNMAFREMPRESAKHMIGSVEYGNIKREPSERAEARIGSYKKMFPGSREVTILEKKLASVRKFDAGNPAVDFVFKTIDGKETRLSNLKGKVVLVDFWASWCGPCIGEMPSAKKVREHFKGKDVAFVYVSIDDDEASWKKAIEKYQIEGMHTLSKGNWNSPIAKLYGIEGVPAYYLIDKKGNYALKEVPRPSETEKLITEIDKLLQ